MGKISNNKGSLNYSIRKGMRKPCARISQNRIRDSRRKGDFEPTNKESNGNSSDEEDNQLHKCGRKGDAENLNEKKNKNFNEE